VNRIAEMGLHADPKTRLDSCATHGEYEARRFIGSIWSRCPACSAEAAAREQTQAEAKDREAKRQAWRRKIGAAGIPKRFQTRSLAS
jgi:DNA replication protein DnaC